MARPTKTDEDRVASRKREEEERFNQAVELAVARILQDWQEALLWAADEEAKALAAFIALNQADLQPDPNGRDPENTLVSKIIEAAKEEDAGGLSRLLVGSQNDIDGNNRRALFTGLASFVVVGGYAALGTYLGVTLATAASIAAVATGPVGIGVFVAAAVLAVAAVAIIFTVRHFYKKAQAEKKDKAVIQAVADRVKDKKESYRIRFDAQRQKDELTQQVRDLRSELVQLDNKNKNLEKTVASAVTAAELSVRQAYDHDFQQQEGQIRLLKEDQQLKRQAINKLETELQDKKAQLLEKEREVLRYAADYTAIQEALLNINNDKIIFIENEYNPAMLEFLKALESQLELVRNRYMYFLSANGIEEDVPHIKKLASLQDAMKQTELANKWQQAIYRYEKEGIQEKTAKKMPQTQRLLNLIKEQYIKFLEENEQPQSQEQIERHKALIMQCDTLSEIEALAGQALSWHTQMSRTIKLLEHEIKEWKGNFLELQGDNEAREQARIKAERDGALHARHAYGKVRRSGAVKTEPVQDFAKALVEKQRLQKIFCNELLEKIIMPLWVEARTYSSTSWSGSVEDRQLKIIRKLVPALGFLHFAGKKAGSFTSGIPVDEREYYVLLVKTIFNKFREKNTKVVIDDVTNRVFIEGMCLEVIQLINDDKNYDSFLGSDPMCHRLYQGDSVIKDSDFGVEMMSSFKSLKELISDRSPQSSHTFEMIAKSCLEQLADQCGKDVISLTEEIQEKNQTLLLEEEQTFLTVLTTVNNLRYEDFSQRELPTKIVQDILGPAIQLWVDLEGKASDTVSMSSNGSSEGRRNNLLIAIRQALALVYEFSYRGQYFKIAVKLAGDANETELILSPKNLTLISESDNTIAALAHELKGVTKSGSDRPQVVTAFIKAMQALQETGAVTAKVESGNDNQQKQLMLKYGQLLKSANSVVKEGNDALSKIEEVTKLVTLLQKEVLAVCDKLIAQDPLLDKKNRMEIADKLKELVETINTHVREEYRNTLSPQIIVSILSNDNFQTLASDSTDKLAKNLLNLLKDTNEKLAGEEKKSEDAMLALKLIPLVNGAMLKITETLSKGKEFIVNELQSKRQAFVDDHLIEKVLLELYSIHADISAGRNCNDRRIQVKNELARILILSEYLQDSANRVDSAYLEQLSKETSSGISYDDFARRAALLQNKKLESAIQAAERAFNKVVAKSVQSSSASQNSTEVRSGKKTDKVKELKEFQYEAFSDFVKDLGDGDNESIKRIVFRGVLLALANKLRSEVGNNIDGSSSKFKLLAGALALAYSLDTEKNKAERKIYSEIKKKSDKQPLIVALQHELYHKKLFGIEIGVFWGVARYYNMDKKLGPKNSAVSVCRDGLAELAVIDDVVFKLILVLKQFMNAPHASHQLTCKLFEILEKVDKGQHAEVVIELGSYMAEKRSLSMLPESIDGEEQLMKMLDEQMTPEAPQEPNPEVPPEPKELDLNTKLATSQTSEAVLTTPVEDDQPSSPSTLSMTSTSSSDENSPARSLESPVCRLYKKTRRNSTGSTSKEDLAIETVRNAIPKSDPPITAGDASLRFSSGRGRSNSHK